MRANLRGHTDSADFRGPKGWIKNCRFAFAEIDRPQGWLASNHAINCGTVDWCSLVPFRPQIQDFCFAFCLAPTQAE